MGGRSLKLFVASMMALALVASACASKKAASPGSTGTVDTNGGIVYSLDQEPTNYNLLTSDGNEFDMQAIIGRVWPTVFNVDANAKPFLDTTLMDSVTLTSTSPQVVVYQINHKAVWQDGVPFNADDFVYNWQAQSGLPQYTDVGGVAFDAASNAGYRQNKEINASYPQPQLDLVNQLKTVPNVKLDERPGLAYEHLDFNQSNPFLADVNLRKAIAMAVDRNDLIAKTVGQFATGIVPDNNH